MSNKIPPKKLKVPIKKEPAKKSSSIHSKKIQESVGASTIDFQKAIETASIVSRTNHKGIITHVNKNFVAISGYSAKELIGKNQSIINSGYHSKNFWNEMWKTISKGKTWRAEVKNRSKKGNYYWVDTFIMPILDEKGKVREYLSVLGNITLQKELEENKIQEENTNKLILNSSFDAFVSINIKGIITEWNTKAETLFQYSKKETLGKKILSVLKTTQTHQSLFHFIKKGDYKVNALLEMIAHRKNGDGFPIELNVISYKKNKDELFGFFIRDTSDRKNKEIELKNSEINLNKLQSISEAERNEILHRLEKIAEHLPGFIYQFVLRKNGSMCFPFASKGIIDILGTTADEVSEDASSVFRTIHPDDLDTILKSIKTSAENLTTWSVECRVKLSPEKTIWVEGHSSPQLQADGSILWHGYIQNITVRKEATLEVEKNQIFLSNLINNLPGYVYRLKTNPEYTPLFISESVFDVTGYHQDEYLLHRTIRCSQEIHPDDITGVRNKVKQAIDSKSRYECEYRIITKQGIKKWVWEKGSGVFDEEGELKYLEGFVTDITKRKKNEEALALAQYKLAESYTKLSTVLESMEGAVLVESKDRKITLVNNKFLALFNIPVSKNKMIGLDCAESLERDKNFFKNPDQFANDIERLTLNRTMELGSQLNLKDGRYFERAYIPIEDGSGSHLWIYRDITSRKITELKLIESQNRVKAYFDSTTDAIILLDKNFKILDFNKNAELGILEISAKKLKAELNFLDFQINPKLDGFKSSFEKSLLGESFEHEVEVNYLSGTRVWWHIKYIPVFDDHNEIIAVAINARNIDLQKRATDRVRALTNNIPDGFIFEYFINTSRTESKYNYISQGVENVCEIKAESFLENAELSNSMIHEEDRDRVLKEKFNAINSLKDLEIDYRIITQTGKIKWIKSKSKPRRLDDGSILFEGICLDITHQKKLEEDNVESATKLKNILDKMINGVVVASPEGKYTYANSSALKILNINLNQIIGSNVLSDDRKRIDINGNPIEVESLPLSVAITEQRASGNVEFEIKNSLGERVWISINATPLFDHVGNFYGAVASFIDITESRRNTLELEQSESELRAILDASSDTVLFVNSKLEIQNYNKAARQTIKKLYGIDLSIGEEITQLVPLSLLSSVNANIKKALKGERIIEEGEIRFPNKSKIYARYKYLPVKDSKEKIVGVSIVATDITEQKQSEFEKLKSAEQMRFATQLAQMGEWELDLETMTPRWSDEVCRIHEVPNGFAPNLDEAINFYPEDCRDVITTAVQNCIQSGQWYDLTLQIITRKGNKKWIRTVGLAERANGKIVKLFGLFQDINDTKLKEEELLRLALIARKTDNLVVITGADRKIQWVNEAFTRVTGYTSNEAIGKLPGKLLQGAETDRGTIQMVSEALSRNESTKFEILNYTKTGKKYWLDIEIQPVLNQDNKIDFFIAIESDITARKLSEKNLVESEQRFRNLIEDLQIGVLLQDRDAKIMLNNKTALNLLGLSEDQLLGKTSFDPSWAVIRDDGSDFPAQEQPVPVAIQTQQPVKGVIMGVYRPKFKNLIWLQVDAYPILTEQNEIQHVICTFTDVTDVREYQLRLKQNVKEKENLIKEIHHRVKNNLQLISSILFLKIGSIPKSEMQEFLENTRLKIRSIALIHERLLQTSSLNKVDIADYLGKLITDLQLSNTRQDLNVHITSQIEPEIMLLDSAIYYGLIITEIVTNSIKHAFNHKPHGNIDIVLKRIDESHLLLVSDDGSTLPENINPGDASSFGMQLLDIFIKQLNGDVEIIRNEGTSYKIFLK